MPGSSPSTAPRSGPSDRVLLSLRYARPVISEVVALAQAELARLADPVRAPAMQAYMKTSMPFYGVTSPARRLVARRLRDEFPPTTPAEYRAQVEHLWALAHREEKYLAIDVAQVHRRFITFEQLDLYERIIREGAWWDFVDEIAAHLVGRVVLDDRERMRPVLERWIDDPDLWIRRTAILSQLLHKDRTDAPMLFDFCDRRAGEKEFFTRKAIGWALRQYARTDPDAVREFVASHTDSLSGLSIREATKHL
jgi:3-methyladenine DNA glycosylase AlkD